MPFDCSAFFSIANLGYWLDSKILEIISSFYDSMVLFITFRTLMGHFFPFFEGEDGDGYDTH